MPLQIGFKYESAALQAPAPPPGIITTPSSEPRNSAVYSTYIQPPSSQIRSLSPTKAHKQSDFEAEEKLQSHKYPPHNRSRRNSTTAGYFADLPRMAFCLCCCPGYKCVFWACFMELVVSIICWYKILDLLAQTFDDIQIKDVFLIFFLTFWIVTLFTSTGMLVAAHRRKVAQYILPRLIQQIGLLLCAVGLFVILICYFTGGRATIDNWIIWAYELFLESDLTPEDEREMARQLHSMAIVTTLLDIMFISYVSCGLCMTKRYYEKMKEEDSTHFHPVSQNEAEPSAPRQPASNPYYKA